MPKREPDWDSPYIRPIHEGRAECLDTSGIINLRVGHADQVEIAHCHLIEEAGA
ncbi:hypothetical protein GCM10022224_104180 [Nonomuraea antimicrobica]|uniref:Uncharacterized protein n=1 Tax=Nonomuraea antimicrobica TaxID=561173 RepID=A0ABP7EUQ0_9ACTN